MDGGDPVPHQDRADMQRLAAGIHPGVRHARREHAGRHDQQRPFGGDGEHRARPLLCRQSPALREWPQYLSGRQGPAAGRARQRDRRPRQADRGRDGRRLADQRGRLLRRSAEGRAAGHEPARGVHDRRERRILVSTVKPRFYPIPGDGPVGEMLEAMGRTIRAAHIHFIVARRATRTVTHVFRPTAPISGWMRCSG